MAVKVEKLTGIDKAALLLLSLGENRAGEILKRLDDKEVQLLGQNISKVDIVPTKQMAAILEEFCRMIEAPEALVVKGDQFFKNTISRTMDSRRQEELMDKLDLEQSPEFFLKIKKLDSRTVASFLRNEHPQTVAKVLAHLERNQAGMVVAEFPENLQMEVVRRIARLDQVSPAIIEEMDAALREEIALVEEVGGRLVGGSQSVAEILNQMERTHEGAILKRLEEEDQADLAEEIRRYLFTLEDLLGVEDRGIMALLKEVNTPIRRTRHRGEMTLHDAPSCADSTPRFSRPRGATQIGFFTTRNDFRSARARSRNGGRRSPAGPMSSARCRGVTSAPRESCQAEKRPRFLITRRTLGIRPATTLALLTTGRTLPWVPPRCTGG